MQTILAHGVYLSDKELEVLHRYQTSISHCPNSNCSIRSGMCDVRRLMEKGLRVGLGTGNEFLWVNTTGFRSLPFCSNNRRFRRLQFFNIGRHAFCHHSFQHPFIVQIRRLQTSEFQRCIFHGYTWRGSR